MKPAALCTVRPVNLWMAICSLALLSLLSCSGQDSDTDPPPDDGDLDSETGDPSEEEAGDPSEEEEISEPTRFFLGYGEIDITPYPEFDTVLMGSYGIPGMHRAMTGVHDPLMAQAALFTNDAGEAFLLITLDVSGYEFEMGEAGPGIRELRESIVTALQGRAALAPERIVVASSHNHTSTDLLGTAQDIGKMIPRELLEWHVEKITQAAVEAAAERTPVDLYVSETELVGYSGRDDEPAGSGNLCSQIVDNTIAILQAKDAQGNVRLTVANYAKHPTQIEWTLNEASADYIAAYREEVERVAGGRAMFIQSFEAAVHDGPLYASIPGEEGTYEKTDNFGRILAQSVLDGAQGGVKSDRFGIEHREEIITVPTHGFFDDIRKLAKLILRTYTREEGSEYVTLQYVPVSWHRLGTADFVVWPGEPSPEYAVSLRGRMDASGRFLVALGNDQIMYIVDPVSVENDPTGKLANYEVRMGTGLGTGERIMDLLETFGFLNPTP